MSAQTEQLVRLDPDICCWWLRAELLLAILLFRNCSVVFSHCEILFIESGCKLGEETKLWHNVSTVCLSENLCRPNSSPLATALTRCRFLNNDQRVSKPVENVSCINSATVRRKQLKHITF